MIENKQIGEGNSFPIKKQRNSNLELYRIIVMLLIVCHHYVVNSEVITLMRADDFCVRSAFFNIFGAWGKTGINCFVLITGYFMCMSNINWRKYLKLYLQVKFYLFAILFVFVLAGIASVSPKTIMGILPFSKIGDGFTNAFMAFFLFIPFLNITIRNMTKKQHACLIALLLFIYTCLGMIGYVTYNYLSWFCTLYFISSYIRLYGLLHNESVRFWGWTTCAVFLLSVFSIFVPAIIGRETTYYFVADSNHILALLLAVSSFMWFKNLDIKQNRFINMIGASTFGVFLIHTRGEEMRHWLWYDFINSGAHYNDQYYWAYAVGCVVAIFAICSIIDIIRINTLEKWAFSFIDKIALKYKKE